MYKRVKDFIDKFVPMGSDGSSQSESRQQSMIQHRIVDEKEERIRNWGAIEGYMQRSKEGAWDKIQKELEARITLIEKPIKSDPNTLKSVEIQRERLKKIIEAIKPRVEWANGLMLVLQRMGITLPGARLMIWFGWLCVTALGWVFTWIIEQVVTASQNNSKITDIITLFVISFGVLIEKLSNAFPGFADLGWLIVTIGIAMVLFSVVAYLNVQRLSGQQLRNIENLTDVFAQGSANPDISGAGQYQPSRDLDKDIIKKKSRWLIIAITLGLIGFGILLSSIQETYSLSTIFLGYALAAVVVSVMLLIVHNSLEPYYSRAELEELKVLPRWVFRAIVSTTVGLLGLLLVSLLLYSFPTTAKFAQMLAIISIGYFLLLGAAALAVGQIHHNLIKDAHHCFEQLGQMNLRLQNLEKNDVEKPEQEKLRQEEQVRQEELKLQHEIERIRTIYEDAYEMGWTAREMQERRLSTLGLEKVVNPQPA